MSDMLNTPVIAIEIAELLTSNVLLLSEKNIIRRMAFELDKNREEKEELRKLISVIKCARNRKFSSDDTKVNWLVELGLTDEEYDLFNKIV